MKELKGDEVPLRLKFEVVFSGELKYHRFFRINVVHPENKALRYELMANFDVKRLIENPRSLVTAVRVVQQKVNIEYVIAKAEYNDLIEANPQLDPQSSLYTIHNMFGLEDGPITALTTAFYQSCTGALRHVLFYFLDNKLISRNQLIREIMTSTFSITIGAYVAKYIYRNLSSRIGSYYISYMATSLFLTSQLYIGLGKAFTTDELKIHIVLYTIYFVSELVRNQPMNLLDIDAYYISNIYRYVTDPPKLTRGHIGEAGQKQKELISKLNFYQSISIFDTKDVTKFLLKELTPELLPYYGTVVSSVYVVEKTNISTLPEEVSKVITMSFIAYIQYYAINYTVSIMQGLFQGGISSLPIPGVPAMITTAIAVLLAVWNSAFDYNFTRDMVQIFNIIWQRVKNFATITISVVVDAIETTFGEHAQLFLGMKIFADKVTEEMFTEENIYKGEIEITANEVETALYQLTATINTLRWNATLESQIIIRAAVDKCEQKRNVLQSIYAHKFKKSVPLWTFEMDENLK